jgi:hypothetical protein
MTAQEARRALLRERAVAVLGMPMARFFATSTVPNEVADYMASANPGMVLELLGEIAALLTRAEFAESRVAQLEAAISASPLGAERLRYIINEVASTLIDYIDQDSKEGAVMRKAYEDLMGAYDGNYSTVPPDK